MEKGKTGKKKMENNFEIDSFENFENTLRNAEILSMDRIIYTFNHFKKKIYFAGPWFDERSNKIYDTCYKICKIFEKHYDFYFPREAISSSPKDAFYSNVENIKNCDIVLALVSKKDVGTAWEIGMAYSLNKSIILLGYDESTFLSHTNVMLAFTGKCLTINNLGKFLQNGITDADYVKIENDWNGIE